ncbi:hypothetical protein NA57DRAFT_62131 [Rhizodiscina lignyota]|uniref:Uncharacterized protein n=1 Tax=Rhizodiscina lignyota TaxID=1504668 RepID=A0A9P4I680_9PEZI|nr:hypothetical protein NA57DRAFT_62131 [Rhizodiscina lignyota]
MASIPSLPSTSSAHSNAGSTCALVTAIAILLLSFGPTGVGLFEYAATYQQLPEALQPTGLWAEAKPVFVKTHTLLAPVRAEAEKTFIQVLDCRVGYWMKDKMLERTRAVCGLGGTFKQQMYYRELTPCRASFASAHLRKRSSRAHIQICGLSVRSTKLKQIY